MQRLRGGCGNGSTDESTCFFYLTLKSGDSAAIRNMFSQLRAQAARLIKEAVEIAWFMRGGLQYHDIMHLTPQERDTIRDFINEHMESIKKHPFPVY
jgi:hypothetical protein